VTNFCNQLHRDLVKQLAYASVWGTSTKHMPQRVGAAHVLDDQDVVQVMKKKKMAADNSELRGRFRNQSDEPKRIQDRVKKAALKT